MLNRNIKNNIVKHENDSLQRNPMLFSCDEGDSQNENNKQIKSSSFLANFNVINTIIGLGILQIPYIMKHFGIISSILLLFVVFILNIFSTRLLTNCKNISGHNKYFSIADFTYGQHMVYCVQGIIIINNLTVCLIQLIVFSTAAYKVLEIFGLNMSNSWLQLDFLKIYMAILILPYIFAENLGKLRFTSFIAVIAKISFIFGVVLLMVKGTEYKNTGQIEYLFQKQNNFSELLICWSGIVTAFTFSQNYFAIQRSLSDSSDQNMKQITFQSLSFILALYILSGFCGYYLFGDSIQANIFENFIIEGQKDIIILLMMAFFTISGIFTFPLFYFEGRNNSFKFYQEICLKINHQVKVSEFYIFSFILYISIVLVSVLAPDFKNFMGILGSLPAHAISFIFPSLFYLKLQKTSDKKFYRLFALILVIFGLISGLLGLYVNIRNIKNEQ